MGISADPVDRQREFDEAHGLGLTLLSDPSRTVAAQFGAKRFGPAPSRRATYVIDADGTLLGEIKSELNAAKHADEALELLRQRAG